MKKCPVKCAAVWWHDSSMQDDNDWITAEETKKGISCFNNDLTFAMGVVVYETKEEISLAVCTSRNDSETSEKWTYSGIICIPNFAITKIKRLEFNA